MKLTKIVLFLSLALLTTLPVYSQTYTTKSKKAIRLFQDGLKEIGNDNNKKAIDLFQKATAEDNTFVEAHIALADTYMGNKQPELAKPEYWQAATLSPDFHPMIWMSLGKLEFTDKEYEKSRSCFEKLLTYNIKSTVITEANSYLEKLDFIQYCLSNPVPFGPHNLGNNINTQDNEYFPSLTTDGQTLVFTRRFPRTEQTTAATDEEEDFYISTKINNQWTLAKRMPPPVNSTLNEGAQCISPDGKYLFFTGCNRPKGFGSCDIYVCEKIGDQWSEPKNLGPNVNTEYWESQPSISPDNNTLYFTSNRPGGKGKHDIWQTTRDANGNWTAAVNLGGIINTDKSEVSPFIHPDNQTLYFSSDGHMGMGGLDIFYTRKNPATGQWGEPVNLGCPINTEKDDVNLIVSPSGESAYYASDKEGGFGKLDIYSFELYKEARPVAVNYMKGIVADEKTNKKLKAQFEIIGLSSGKTMVKSFSDAKTGEFLVSLPTDQDYALNVSADNYLFHSENFSMQTNASGKPFEKNILLKPIAIGDQIVLKNIFFETDKADLKPESEIELNKLLDFLNKNRNLKVELSGHTDNTGNAQYNLTLSENRAKTVYNYLIEKGIDRNRLSFKGMGIKDPIDTNDTEEGRANNRRTEMKVLGL